MARNDPRIENEARAFQTLTLLLAVAEQALLDLEEIDPPDQELRASIAELCERLYRALQTSGALRRQVSL